MLRGLPPGVADHGHQQDDGPEAEHDLHLAEEVEDFGGNAGTCRHPPGSLALVVAVLHVARTSRESCRGERVKDGQEEDGGRDRVERLEMDALGQHVRDRVGAARHFGMAARNRNALRLGMKR